MAAQLVTKTERGRDTGTERAMGGRAEDPIQSTAGRPPREEEEKGGSTLRGGADERERERRKDKRLSPVYNAQVL